MGQVRFHKVVSALPSPLEKDGLYLVRTGEGFDLYASDSTGAIAHKVNTGAAEQPPADLLDYRNRKSGEVYLDLGARVISRDPLKINSFGLAAFDADFLRPSVPAGGWKPGKTYTLSILTDNSVSNLTLKHGSNMANHVGSGFKATPLGDVNLHIATFTWPVGVEAPRFTLALPAGTVTFYDFKLEEGDQSTLLPFAEYAQLALKYLQSVIQFDTGWRDLSSEIIGLKKPWSFEDVTGGGAQGPRYTFSNHSRVLARKIGDRGFLCLDFTADMPPTGAVKLQSERSLPQLFQPERPIVLPCMSPSGSPDANARIEFDKGGMLTYTNTGDNKVKPSPVVIEYRLRSPQVVVNPLPGKPAQVWS